MAAGQAGVPVKLHEMRPNKQTAAHHTDKFAELVCSNSLRANNLTNAVGVLKEEMRNLDSVIIEAADAASVPAGGALAVDRTKFAANVTNKVKNHPLVEVVSEEVTHIPDEPAIIATGPLTAESLSEDIFKLTGEIICTFMMQLLPLWKRTASIWIKRT
ncbi:FAD-dependent oxidoreductase [Marinococcus halophilus]|uniref:FAD-dependent oxidoreductase n=1 Tax=Marinococcus halophilus TaxID=1371 RepID=UPI00361B9617